MYINHLRQHHTSEPKSGEADLGVLRHFVGKRILPLPRLARATSGARAKRCTWHVARCACWGERPAKPRRSAGQRCGQLRCAFWRCQTPVAGDAGVARFFLLRPVTVQAPACICRRTYFPRSLFFIFQPICASSYGFHVPPSFSSISP